MTEMTSIQSQVNRAPDGSRSSIRSHARASLRDHRLTVLASLLLISMCAVSALIILAQVVALDPSPDCWQTWYDAGETGGVSSCRSEIDAFSVAAAPARFLTETIGPITMTIVGLLLTVPVTARAARRGAGTDARTMAARLLPMLLIGVAGFAFVAFLFGVLRGEILEWSYLEWGGGRRMQVEEMGYEGVAFVGRGVLAMGVGALMGAVVRRPMLAGTVAAGLLLGYAMLGTPVVQSQITHAVATPVVTLNGGPWAWSIGYDGIRYRLPNGSLATIEDAIDAILRQCPTCDSRIVGQQVQRTMERVTVVAEPSSYSTFFAVELLISVGVGVACLLLTFPIVRRRSRRVGGSSSEVHPTVP